MINSTPPIAPARTRRLSDKRRLLFHTACDEAAFSVAEQRLNQLCQHVASLAIPPVGAQRRKPESLSGACERLATLLLWKAENGTDAAAQEVKTRHCLLSEAGGLRTLSANAYLGFARRIMMTR